jgi:hypothetical protein
MVSLWRSLCEYHSAPNFAPNANEEARHETVQDKRTHPDTFASATRPDSRRTAMNSVDWVF